MMTRRLFLPALIAGMALSGCGDAPPPPPADEPPPAEAPAPEAAPMDEMFHATIPLHEVNGSQVSGEAMAMHADDAVIVVIDLEGLPDEGEYDAHVHTGTCAEGGPVATPLNPILGLADGTGNSTTTLDADELPVGEPHFIQILGDGGSPLACGDIEGHGERPPGSNR
jgi:hypothetical protein